MYLFSFLIFSVLVVNTIAANVTDGNESDFLKNITEAAIPLCECSKYPLNAEPKCKVEDQQAYNGIIKLNKTSLTDYIDRLCKNIKEPKGMVITTSSTEHYETKTPPGVHNGTQGLKGIVSTTSSTEHYEIKTPKKVQTETHDTVSRINYLGCECVSSQISTPESTMNSLNCTSSQKTLDFYHPPAATVEMFNAFCQNLTWESLPPAPIDKAISTFLCKKDEKHCLEAKSALDSMKKICACSNASMGPLTTPCKDEDKKAWLSLNETIRSKIDKLCVFVGNLSTEPDEVITTEKIVTTPETTTKKTKKTKKNQKNMKGSNVITTTAAAIAGSAKQHMPVPKDPAQTYSLKLVILIGFAAFACGTLATIAAKMSYTRYKRRTYAVNQVRS